VSRPRLLDLFCGAGGAAMGYARAGFEVVGVDIAPQPHYPFEFYCYDALEWLRDGSMYAFGFAAIHASPPCQPHSSLTGWGASRRVKVMGEDLIAQTRELLQATGLPYVIENVGGAPLENAVMICGQSLGLRVRRHRWFESNVALLVPECIHPGPPVIVVRGSIGRKVFDPRRKAIAPSLELAREVMEMPWAVTAGEVCDAIPPAYTELIGHQLLSHIRSKVAA
jgi:DNA (cytosine-5)-methyltransferase 1